MVERWDLIYRGGVAFGGAATVYLFGGWSALLGVLLSFVIVDYLTGLGAAWVNGELNSDIGRRGIVKKVCIFLMVGVGHLIDVALQTEIIIMTATVFFYLSIEALSIIENVGRIGLPVPQKLKDAIAVLNGKSEAQK